MTRLIITLAFLWLSGFVEAKAETGIASVYSTHDKDQPGTKTASGIPLNNGKATIAHKSRRLGSSVRVTNLGNGRSGVFQVTDRGPYVRGRIIDLSVAAARQLECHSLCRVRVD